MASFFNSTERIALLLVAAFVLLLLPALPVPVVYQIDGSFYAYAGWNMWQTGDWLVPQYINPNPYCFPALEEPRYQKLILHYWLTAGSVGAFGSSLLATRLPSLLFTAFIALLIPAFARRLFASARAGLIAVAVFLSCFLTFEYARVAMTDMTNIFFAWAGMLAFFRWYFGGRDMRFALLAWILVGLSGMNKGPPGPMFTIGLAAPYLLIVEGRERWRTLWQGTVYGLGPLVFLVLVLWWPAYMYFFVMGDEFLAGLLGLEYADRMAGPFQNFITHLFDKSYPLMSVTNTLPWSLIVLAFVFTKAGRDLFRNRAGDAEATPAQQRYIMMYLVAWAVVPLLTAMFAGLYKPNYLIPGLLPFCLLAGTLIDRGLDVKNGGAFYGWPRRVVGIFIVAAFVLILVLALILAAAIPVFGELPVRFSPGYLLYLLLPLAGLAGTMYLFFVHRRYPAALTALALSMTAVYMSALWAVPRAVNQRPEPEMAAFLKSLPQDVNAGTFHFTRYQTPWFMVDGNRKLSPAQIREDGVACYAQFDPLIAPHSAAFAALKRDSDEPWVFLMMDYSTTTGTPIHFPAPEGYHVVREYLYWRNEPYSLVLRRVFGLEAEDPQDEDFKRYYILANDAAKVKLGE